jgi:F420-non-reducing hydrogenase iron-sulfur subunit
LSGGAAAPSAVLGLTFFACQTADMENSKVHITIFYCSQQEEKVHRILTGLDRFGGVKFRRIPLPCSGKMEIIHLTKALESGADGVALFGCSEGTCRYLVGSSRARGRVAQTGRVLEEIGLGKDRLRRFVLGNQVPDETARELGEWAETIRSLGAIGPPKMEDRKLKLLAEIEKE